MDRETRNPNYDALPSLNSACGSEPSLASCALGFFIAVAGLLATADAQTPQQGLHYYVLQNRDSAQIVQRGTTGNSGVAFDRLILAPDTRYRIWVLQAASLLTGYIDVTSAGNGESFRLPPILLGTDISYDSDGDELGDDGEFILGTNPNQRDTDGDGIADGAEVRQGTDPNSGRAVRTGIIASADTPGEAKDICAINDLAILAVGTAGVSVFNVFNGMNPVLVTQVDTPGEAVAVACGSSTLLAVGDGPAGLGIIDIRDPPASKVERQVHLGAAARAVAAADTFAFVGLANGHVVVVDMVTGAEVARANISLLPIQDLFLASDYLYAIVEGKLFVLSFHDGDLSILGSVNSPGGVNTDNGRMRLFVGGNIAYPVHRNGYNTIDVSVPGTPQLIPSQVTTQFGWKQIVANGSGLGIAAVSPNQAFDGPHEVSLYDLRNPASNNVFIVQFQTPGVARSVSVYNGLAYVADHLNGLQVINYLAYDVLGLPPTISLSTSFASGVAEEGKLMRVTATVTDDVQVRNVEFYVDDVKAATDGNFPFEHRFVTPLIVAGRNSFTIRARASDTGGNAVWSDTLTMNLVPDATPPRVVRAVPGTGSVVGPVDTVAAYFSEPVVVSTLTPSSVRLLSAGPDNIFGTPDDSLVSGGTISYRDTLNLAVLSFSADLQAASYRLLVGPAVTDRAGNSMSAEFNSGFRVFSMTDNDNDGVPDELEPSLGLDPTKPDTDGDGIIDGLEDFDNDGLTNAGEVIVGTNPSNPDTDGDGINDGNEDTDGDTLTDRNEVLRGTNPTVADTDGDGWNDEAEVTGLSDPLNPASKPRLLLVASPRFSLGLPHLKTGGAVASSPTLAMPKVTVGLPRIGSGTLVRGAVISQPRVSIGLSAVRAGEGTAGSIIIGLPRVTVGLPSLRGGLGATNNPTIAQPPTKVGFGT